MKIIEKKIYELELTDEERNALNGAKQFFYNLTCEEWEDLSKFIAREMGFDEEDWQEIDQRINEVCEYFETLPL